MDLKALAKIHGTARARSKDNFKVGKYFGREFRRKRRWINGYITKFERKTKQFKTNDREFIMLLDEEELENYQNLI